MRRFRRTTLITVGSVSVLAGLGASRKIGIEPEIWLLTFLPTLILLKKKNIASLILVMVLGFSLGLWRGNLYMQKLADINGLAQQKVTIEASASSDAVYGTRSQIEFTASQIKLLRPRQRNLTGNAKISGFGVPMVYRGDRVLITGKLYPMRGANQIRIAYAQLKIVAVSDSWFGKLTRTFSTGMENALPEPQASFGLGLLVGQRTNLPADIVTQLTAVGLVHIVAVSGYNLTILVRAAQRLRIRSKYQRTLMTLGLILAFILVTGFSASIVRAAIVSVLSLWAWYYGRAIKPVLIIFFSAALTALFNPFYVWSDIGWYLSFLAFFGVLVVAPLISARFKKPPQLLTQVIVETLSAEIMTLPLIMMTFGQMSLIALIANALVVPVIPVAMLASAVAALGGALIPAYAGWLAWPANLLLTYILDLVHMMSHIPHVVYKAGISPTLMLSTYTLVVVALAVLHKRFKPKVA